MTGEPSTDYRETHTGEGRGKIYDTRYRSGGEAFYWENLERPLLARLFHDVSTRHGKRYLDVACGTGRILEVAAPSFDDVVGVDISEPMLVEARRKVPFARVLQMDVTTGKNTLGRFDVVSLFRFLLNAEPHLREGALAWIRSALSENGVLIANNHLNSASPLGLLLRLRNRQLGTRRHNVLSDTDVHALMAAHGLKITRSFGFGFIPMFRGRIILPRMLLLYIEKGLMALPFLQRFAKDRIYICMPFSNQAAGPTAS
jgi:SAM-dependent methyltransferase